MTLVAKQWARSRRADRVWPGGGQGKSRVQERRPGGCHHPHPHSPPSQTTNVPTTVPVHLPTHPDDSTSVTIATHRHPRAAAKGVQTVTLLHRRHHHLGVKTCHPYPGLHGSTARDTRTDLLLVSWLYNDNISLQLTLTLTLTLTYPNPNCIYNVLQHVPVLWLL